VKRYAVILIVIAIVVALFVLRARRKPPGDE
jgi:hypothetical protein